MLFLKSSYFDLLERAVFEWICSVKANNLPVTVGLVKEKAIDVAKALVEQYKDADIEIQNKLHLAKLREFAASAQWYKNFARRFGLNTGKQAGVFLISVSVVGSASLILLCFCFMKVRLPPSIWK